MTKKVYRYDDTKKYAGIVELDDTDRSPVSGRWQIPAGCTEVAPPAEKDGFEIVWDGVAWAYSEFEKDPEPEPSSEPTLDETKSAKLLELKCARDTLEVANVEYNGNTYDFDDKSRARLDIALKALQLQGDAATIDWTMADNGTATITANDILQVFTAAAVRSNKLHQRYRSLKEQVSAAEDKAAVEAINF